LTSALEKVLPDAATAADAKLRLLDLAQKGELAALDAEVRLALAQIDVNKTEAQQPSIFKSGPRPAALWVCVASMGYTFLLRPLLPWCLTVAGVHDVPPLPDVDGEALFALLTGLLGLSGIRSVERLKGKA
jgi:hypothetical protein